MIQEKQRIIETFKYLNAQVGANPNLAQTLSAFIDGWHSSIQISPLFNRAEKLELGRLKANRGSVVAPVSRQAGASLAALLQEGERVVAEKKNKPQVYRAAAARKDKDKVTKTAVGVGGRHLDESIQKQGVLKAVAFGKSSNQVFAYYEGDLEKISKLANVFGLQSDDALALCRLMIAKAAELFGYRDTSKYLDEPIVWLEATVDKLEADFIEVERLRDFVKENFEIKIHHNAGWAKALEAIVKALTANQAFKDMEDDDDFNLELNVLNAKTSD